jgi:hypothetical protein
MMTRETSTDYRHPYRPGPVRLANRVLERLPAPLTVSLDKQALLAAAQRRTGLSDFGDASFHPALEVLLASIEAEARLHPVGRLIVRTRIVASLATRLRLEALFRAQPAIAGERLARPIVVLGLPRTGTTLLHRLLAADAERVRALMSWESLMPVPLPGEHGAGKRIAAAERSERALKYLAPDFFAVHPIDARGPEEDILLLDLAFRSTVAEATMRVPSYAAWLEAADQAPAYRMLARALQALQWQRKPRAAHRGAGDGWRWVLKTPHHLEWVDEIPKVLPDPLFVWTHRSPRDVVGSFCSMIAHGRGVFSDDVDPLEIGRAWLRKGKRMVDRALAARSRLGEASFVDVRYAELVRDPLATVRAIEERAGLPFTAEAERQMKASMQREAKDRHGKHRYALADFGLDEAAVDDAFADYRRRFAL